MAVPVCVLITVVVGTSRPAGTAHGGGAAGGCWAKEATRPPQIRSCVAMHHGRLPELDDAVAVTVWRSSRPAAEWG